jgi:DNA repair protein RadC
MIQLKHFERCPKLAEIRAVYKSRTKVSGRTNVRQPADVVEYLRAIWNPGTLELLEEVLVVCLNGNHQAIGWVKVASGGFNAAKIDPRLVFAVALQTASSAIILAHNHPSGNLQPSAEDQAITRRLKEAGDILGIHVLDHVILTRDSYYSFEEAGLM